MGWFAFVCFVGLLVADHVESRRLRPVRNVYVRADAESGNAHPRGDNRIRESRTRSDERRTS